MSSASSSESDASKSPSHSHSFPAHLPGSEPGLPLHPSPHLTATASAVTIAADGTPAALAESESSDDLSHLFAKNRAWAASVEANYPGFFRRLANQQHPKYLWIGCSDSRVPASEITGLMPGEVFVHRNVGNCVLHSDLNVHSVIQIAVDVLKIEHIIVCGHYQCAGVSLALENKSIGLADHWIRNIKDVAVRYSSELDAVPVVDRRKELLVELNVGQSVENVCFSSTVQNAWERGQKVSVHGWVYSVGNGLLKDLIQPPISNIKQVHQLFHLNRNSAVNKSIAAAATTPIVPAEAAAEAATTETQATKKRKEKQ